MSDLKLQVRYEVMRNENVEKGLERIPRLEEELQNGLVKIAGLEKEAGERSLLLLAARRAALDYRDRLREMERQRVDAASVSEELLVAQIEVDTLKRLLGNKDVLVLRKCQTLQQAKNCVDLLQAASVNNDEAARLRAISHVMDQLVATLGVGRQLQAESNQLQKPLDDKEWRKNEQNSIHDQTSKGRFHSSVQQKISEEKDKTKHSVQKDKPTHERRDHAHKQSSYAFFEKLLAESEPMKSRDKYIHRNISENKKKENIHSKHLIRRSDSFNQLNLTRNHPRNQLDTQRRAQSALRSGSPPAWRRSPRVTARAGAAVATNVYVSGRVPTLSAKYNPTLNYVLGVNADDPRKESTKATVTSLSPRQEPGHESGDGTPTSRPFVNKSNNETELTVGNPEADLAGPGDGDLDDHGSDLLAEMSEADKEALASQVIQHGDRVRISVPQKPPRYGRKKSKPILYSGIVKYKGMLSKDPQDSKIYIGIRLDEPNGDSDGTFQGRRYMFAPADHAKFFHILDLGSVFHVDTAAYYSLSTLMLRQISAHAATTDTDNCADVADSSFKIKQRK